MKVFVSTKQTQGQRKNDYSWTDDGELVYVSGNECDGESVDGRCGCRRGFSGATSHRATTTAIVEERECDTDALTLGILDTLRSGGWGKYSTDSEMYEWARSIAEDMHLSAAVFESGTIVEKRGNTIRERIPA